MHNIKKRLARIERKHLLIACAITISFAIIVILTTILLIARMQVPPNATPVHLSGEIVCLPHKNSNAPQTLECAYGLHTDDDHYFGLQSADISSHFSVSDRVEVSGMLTVGTDNVYATNGIIKVDSVKQPQ
jgi:hypothetical protein